MPVAAPISPPFTKWWPRASSCVLNGVARNAGSALVFVPFRWLARGSGIARGGGLPRAGIGDRLREGHPLVETVEEDLQDGRDDRRPARRAEREERLLAVEHDRRSH